MSRTRIVKGTYTKISEKGHGMYSNQSIITTATKEIKETSDKGVTYGAPQNPPQVLIKQNKNKIKFRPIKILPQSNIIAVIEKDDEILKMNDEILISGNLVKDNWVNVNGKLYIIPKNISLYGNIFFKINNNIYQSIDNISNCKSFKEYQVSIDEQLAILKEFVKDIENSNLKHKKHIMDRISYDGYYRYISCIKEIEVLFKNTEEEENVKSWIKKILEN